MVFTGTAALRNDFFKLGLRPVVIGPGKPERLDTDERAQYNAWVSKQSGNSLTWLGLATSFVLIIFAFHQES